MNKEEWMYLSDQYIMGTYKRFPVVFARGKGMKLWDTEGREYLDFVAGIAVCSLGHAHPEVSNAIKSQVDKLVHVSNLYYIDIQIEYARLLIQQSALDKVFFCNSGAEANEGAIKLAKKYGNDRSGGIKNEIVTMSDSFHGRTMATITATGQDKFHKGFNPLLAGFQYVPFNDVGALGQAISEKTCAVMIEPIQAEGGIRVPDPDYFQSVRRLCDEKDVLLI
ncbi:MAG: aminotransferase class III-fold pyridoxal phosphate-dependent enzyme, partial [Syntrophales bacterium]